MLRFLFAALLLFSYTGATTLAQPSPKGKIPLKASNQLKPYLDKLKTPSGTKLEDSGPDFLLTRELPSQAKVTTALSDYADKPFVAYLTWSAIRQDSKLYTDPEKAQKATIWLPPGKKAGSKVNGTYTGRSYKATLYYENDKWNLDDIEWNNNLNGISGPIPVEALRRRSIKTGEETVWQEVLIKVQEAK